MEELIVASLNKGKIKEIQNIFGNLFVVKSMEQEGIAVDIEENGTTFTQNALIKARTLFDLLPTKKAVLSDDSGLEVDALFGEPGIYSARYAKHGDDEANIQKLLKNMAQITDRKARFVSAIAFIDKNGNETTAIATVEGEILYNKLGNNGFGYDSIFYSFDLKKSFGQADSHEKNAISHRAKALHALHKKIKKNFENLQ